MAFVRAHHGLGIAPLVATGIVAVGGALGGLAALIQNALDDDWADSTVFNSHAADIHRAMLAIQCLVGGAQPNAPLVDTAGNTVCPGGTRPGCKLTQSQVIEWRGLRDGFSQFWASVGSPSNAEAQRLKDYAVTFYQFYQKIASTCEQQGVDLPVPPVPPPPPQPENAPVILALKYGAWIVGGVAAIWVTKTLFEVFKK